MKEKITVLIADDNQEFSRTLATYLGNQEDMEIISLHNGNYRIVCFCEESFSNILYILAFDWDFSLYNH